MLLATALAAGARAVDGCGGGSVGCGGGGLGFALLAASSRGAVAAARAVIVAAAAAATAVDSSRKEEEQEAGLKQSRKSQLSNDNSHCCHDETNCRSPNRKLPESHM